ncbi:hypothetical protein BAUCODRAFT_144978 [Baudoinia panamericana UAMH 10762]|uniref:Uncharacterized protein n=1 Tax=Baudoinia panamericana (strain UAMH 10762) TaxID=717646 RepID=M2MRW6_BAUPA|nr:uncharacterized protein BAUCODRAFT_144978 [Baudoinia panamericana UAMH 10762]EMC99576.1 hypothetical protein BAUCODRAFT_144978 [Baudoinia panamericana UAMH 10762]
MDSIRRAFRSMFKRGKRDKQEQSRETSRPAVSQGSAALPKKAPQAVASGQQQPPRNIPPTHPLATGTHDKPQPAIPQADRTKPDSTPVATVAGGTGGEEETKMEPLSFARPQPEEPARTVQFSAQKDGKPPAPPPNKDTADDVVQISSGEVVAATTAIPQPVSLLNPPTSEQQQKLVDPASKENETPRSISAVEDKIPVMHEPPPIRAVRAAPGMSATSGPLEDFPEGSY